MDLHEQAEISLDSSINFAVRYWHAADIASRWRVRSAAAISIKTALDTAGMTIPFPQRVLWLPESPASSPRLEGRPGRTPLP